MEYVACWFPQKTACAPAAGFDPAVVFATAHFSFVCENAIIVLTLDRGNVCFLALLEIPESARAQDRVAGLRKGGAAHHAGTAGLPKCGECLRWRRPRRLQIAATRVREHGRMRRSGCGRFFGHTGCGPRTHCG